MVNYILSKSPNGLFLIFERSVQFDFTIRLNFKVKIEIDFDTEAVTPFYVVSKNKIILPYKFMLLKSSNNILDHEIFNFFLFHELGHAVLDQNSPQIYKIKMIQDIFYYLGKKYSQINP